jgi:putative membrane protein
MAKQRNLMAGVVAGVAGGLAAAWVMNEFIAGPGKQLQTAIARVQGHEPAAAGSDDVDSTGQVADTFSVIATGGQHLTNEQKTKAGNVIHYGFGALMGGIYGGLGEYAPSIRAGMGTTFATALFTGADVIAVPALNLGRAADEQDAGSLAEHYAAHLIYGLATELVRKIVRAAL